jgi:DNA repair protein RadC
MTPGLNLRAAARESYQMHSFSPVVSTDTVAAFALLTGLTADVAANVLTESHGVRGLVANGSAVALTKSKVARVNAIATLAHVFAAEALPLRPKISTPDDVVKLLGPTMRDLRQEEFHLVLLDTRSNVLRDVTLTRGLLDSTLVHPREVFRAAIREAAAGMIIVHNHPSGDPTPSAEDRLMTRQLIAAGQLLDIPVYDHVIIAGDRFTSFATAGLL